MSGCQRLYECAPTLSPATPGPGAHPSPPPAHPSSPPAHPSISAPINTRRRDQARENPLRSAPPEPQSSFFSFFFFSRRYLATATAAWPGSERRDDEKVEGDKRRRKKNYKQNGGKSRRRQKTDVKDGARCGDNGGERKGRGRRSRGGERKTDGELKTNLCAPWWADTGGATFPPLDPTVTHDAQTHTHT
ncbi:hypothetical protein NL108_007807 [Boleophthalmus pectinirostris]|nr:hypothetical protein NL108_007807 [Boleophthalmus pectinirostris]